MQKFMSVFVFFLLFFFSGALLSSYVVVASPQVSAGLTEKSVWLTENWVIIALILSELAAVLPGKPKGILHAILKAFNRLFSQNSFNQKNVSS